MKFGRLSKFSSRKAMLWFVIVVVTVLTEATCIAGFQWYGDKVLRDGLATTAEVAATAFDGRDVAKLNGLPSDATEHELSQAVETLRLIHSAMPETRFVYLLGQRRGEIVFLADATAPESSDYSAPGDPYPEATPALRQLLLDRTSVVEGPASDQWGTWVSGLASIENPDDGRIVAVLGIDFDAGQWAEKIAGFQSFGVAVGAALIVLELLFAGLISNLHRAAARLQTADSIIDSSATVIYRVAAKPGFPLTFVSDNVSLYGYEAREILASPAIYHSLVHPDDQILVGRLLGALAEGGELAPTQIRVKTKQGEYRWVEYRMFAIRDARGRLVAGEGTMVDITARRELEDRVRHGNTILTTTLETSPDAILVVDESFHASTHNSRFLEMWHIPPEVIAAGDDAPMVALVAKGMKDPDAFATRVQYLYDHRSETAYDELETKDGRFIERHSAPLLDGGNYIGRVWFFRDVSAYRRAEAKIRHTAGHDPLTGLANRRAFLDAMKQAIARAERGEKNFAVLFIDLDHFKDVNDMLGHPTGDELLRAVGNRFVECVRSIDVVSRFGGDEFAVLMTSIAEPEDAATLATKLIAAAARPFALSAGTVRTGASIGIIVREPDNDDAETVLGQADVALYRAKTEGRGTYRFFTEVMNAEVHDRLNLAAELREAIESGQLFLEYQPQVEIETGRIVGLEALVRWHHPLRGSISPDDFISVAEKAGLIGALGRWVLIAACHQVKLWIDSGITVPRVAVNVSALQFKMALELEEDIAQALAAYGLPPQALEIELTETALMAAGLGLDVLHRMRESGLTLAIDDFGTGYSSLSYLRRFRVDRLKIAQEFVKLILADPGSATIVRATIGLAKELQIVAIAEGVESVEQLRLLQAWGCPQVQGYCYSPPLGPDEVAVLLRKGVVAPTRQRILAAVA